MATPAPGKDILDQPHDHNFPKCKLGQTSKFTDLLKVPGLADGNGCTMYEDIPDQPHDHNFPKREFGQTSKFTNLFKVPGLADGNGCTMSDATDLAFYHCV